MARRHPQSARLETLSRQLDASRAEISRAAVVVRHRLDVPSRFRGSLRRRPAAWFAGSLAAGLLASLALRRRHQRRKLVRSAPRQPTAITIAGTLAGVFTLLRPVLQKWMLHQLRNRW